MLPYNSDLKKFSQKLRRNATKAERKLWKYLRCQQIDGLHFYRQKPLGNYIVDFYCPRARLVIEIDGSQHLEKEAKEYDTDRDAFLNELGLRVLRFTNYQVHGNIQKVVEKIQFIVEVRKKINRQKSPSFAKEGVGGDLNYRVSS